MLVFHDWNLQIFEIFFVTKTANAVANVGNQT